MKQQETGRFVKVTDGRGKPIEGLWNRNGAFYVQLRLRDPETGVSRPTRKRLKAINVTDAKKELRSIVHNRDTGKGPAPKVLSLRDHLTRWLDDIKVKKPRSYVTRKSQVKFWQSSPIANQKIDTIQPAQIRAIVTEQMTTGDRNNTVRGRLDALGMVFKQAMIDGMVAKNPVALIDRPERENKARKIYTLADIRRFADKQREQPTYGADGHDLTLFLAFSGMRLGEALKTKWDHIDWEAQQVKVGIGYKPKNGKPREVDFNPMLRAHLEDMKGRRVPDSDWLFPSYHGRNQHATEPPVSWAYAKEKTGMAIDPHDLRHFFISFCVMSGCDWLSIAQWVGHSDATLIAKVYAHLRPEYRRTQAKKITFEPVVMEKAS